MFASALLLGAGVASGVTALVTFFTRYSRFDALVGEIDATLYAQVTQMAPAERAALVAAALLVAASLLGLLSLLRRPPLQSQVAHQQSDTARERGCDSFLAQAFGAVPGVRSLAVISARTAK